MMKLTYFNVRGIAETIRMIFAVNNQNGDREEYDDFRYPLEVINMKTHQMIKDEFDSDKADGKLVKSLNKLPFLEVDGHVIPQSKSIERFLAHRFGLMGNDEFENAHIDSICECVRDFKDMYQKVRVAEDVDTAMNTWFTVTLIERLTLLENLLNDNGFSVGNKLSLSDIVLYSFITNFFDNKEASMNATLATPNLRKIVTHVGELPQIRDWVDHCRPKTDF
jgi:glutathione S-transferase